MWSDVGRQERLTFKANLRHTRYGWLRLTPAYSVHLVRELVSEHWRRGGRVLDPFCGTGTTALVCAERGIECVTTDINPFLLWLAEVKAAKYSASQLDACRRHGARIGAIMRRNDGATGWTPPLHRIERWWSPPILRSLACGMAAIRRLEQRAAPPVTNLLKVAFCRTLIEHANVSFGHQSMSFDKREAAASTDGLAATWRMAVGAIADAAACAVTTVPKAVRCDARCLELSLERDAYQCVITSPPYPNRMSYIRELRPYMYWLGYLADGRQAGELDWQAIGGTWGIATSNVAKWEPASLDEPDARLSAITAAIERRSRVLSRYVTKYFHDMLRHLSSLFAVVRAGGTIHYIVGNSKFYDVVVPVEDLYASMFEKVGFAGANVTAIRKRSSKKELYEFVVSATKPPA